MYDMVNIFETFLPQLLRYPNPSDPLNGEAAALLMRDPKAYDGKVKGPPGLTFARYRVLTPEWWEDYVAKYATKQAADDAGSDEEEEEDEEMSDLGDFSDDDQV